MKLKSALFVLFVALMLWAPSVSAQQATPVVEPTAMPTRAADVAPTWQPVWRAQSRLNKAVSKYICSGFAQDQLRRYLKSGASLAKFASDYPNTYPVPQEVRDDANAYLVAFRAAVSSDPAIPSWVAYRDPTIVRLEDVIRYLDQTTVPGCATGTPHRA